MAVVAGPGTGKTKTLVDRIAWLVEERGVRPGEITAVTFTNQAAAEMRQRLEERLGGGARLRRMTIGTFHAICLALLGDVRLIGQGEALAAGGGDPPGAGPEGERTGAAPGGVPGEKRRVSGDGWTGRGDSTQAYCARLEELGDAGL